MATNDELLALADELEGVSLKDDCESCLASGTGLCRGDVECAESAHKACAKRLREVVERDECEVTTVSAYDLLSDDDREAIAWVREMGGVEAAKARMMPEGCEWPRFEDGEPVKLRDVIVPPEGGEPREVDCINHFKDCWYIGLAGASSERLKRGERVKRPAVLAADGEPLEVGQTVWDENGDELVVLAIYGKDVHCKYAEFEDQICDNGTWEPSQLTHQRPVLDADGVPIYEGDHGWWLEQPGVEIIVKHIDRSECLQLTVYDVHGRGNTISASEFTHTKPEPPDSWERVEEDARKDRCSYFGVKYQDCGRCTQLATSCSISKARDLVRRCRALAERGER